MTRREAQLEDLLQQCGAALRQEQAESAKLRKRLAKRPQAEPRIETREVVVRETPKSVVQQLARQQREINRLRANLENQRQRLAFLLREFEARRPLSELWSGLTSEEKKMAIRTRLRRG